jgi:hypothetical protein
MSASGETMLTNDYDSCLINVESKGEPAYCILLTSNSLACVDGRKWVIILNACVKSL